MERGVQGLRSIGRVVICGRSRRIVWSPHRSTRADCLQKCLQTRSCEMNVCYVRVYAANILNMNSDSQKDKKKTPQVSNKAKFPSNFWFNILQNASWKHGCWNRSNVSPSDPNCSQCTPQISGCAVGSWRAWMFWWSVEKFNYHHEAENRHVVLTGRTTQTHDHLHRHDASLQIKPTNSR